MNVTLSQHTLSSLLAMVMSDISEDTMCAGWEADLEYTLWDVVHGRPPWSRWEHVATEDKQMLKELSEALGGWVVLDRASGDADIHSRMYAHRFVPLEEWLKMYETHHIGATH